jgi:septal ring factor EnvC (AmiA/AmiB activator)
VTRKPFIRPCLLLACGLLLPTGITAQPALTREEAQSRLRAVQDEIRELQQSLAAARDRYAGEQRALRDIDLAIQDAALKLRATGRRIERHREELERLQADREAYLADLGARHEFLSAQVVAAYRLGRQSRLRLLLNQDSPARLGRMLAYYDYFSTAQAHRIKDLREALATLDRMQTGIDAELAALSAAQEEQREALGDMQRGRAARAGVLAELAGRIDSDAARLVELSRNRADLEALLERLANALADIPSDLGGYRHPSTQRGALPMPLQGRVLHAFGQPRTGGLHWQGWLIAADSGTEVSAIAYGRVAYADWLRGYGLLMIIDHGEGFMSLYGNNESLLFEVGDWVQRGTAISTVGKDSGTGQGLYFELRDSGKAIDPAAWISRR